MHKTFRVFTGKTYLLNEVSYFGINRSDAEKRKAMWKESGLGARLVKKANNKYAVYLGYHGEANEVDGSALFPIG